MDKKGSLEKILEVADLKTCSPKKEYIAKAREAALSTGDYNALSATDIDVLALAIDFLAAILIGVVALVSGYYFSIFAHKIKQTWFLMEQTI